MGPGAALRPRGTAAPGTGPTGTHLACASCCAQLASSLDACISQATHSLTKTFSVTFELFNQSHTGKAQFSAKIGVRVRTQDKKHTRATWAHRLCSCSAVMPGGVHYDHNMRYPDLPQVWGVSFTAVAEGRSVAMHEPKLLVAKGGSDSAR